MELCKFLTTIPYRIFPGVAGIYEILFYFVLENRLISNRRLN